MLGKLIVYHRISQVKNHKHYLGNLKLFFCGFSFRTRSNTMPGSLGHEVQDAGTFAQWVSIFLYKTYNNV